MISLLNSFLENLQVWIDEIPPIQQPMRFGNKAFRDFHARLLEVRCYSLLVVQKEL